MPVKKQTIIFGGAFNPPTIAHHAIIQACVNHARTIDADVWLLPSGNRTDKVINADEQRRLDYLHALMEDLDTHGVELRLDTTELTREILVETYDTVFEFRQRYPAREFIWVFGADSTQTMREWKEGAWLMANITMLLLKRPGSDIHPDVAHYTPMTIPVMDTSSTELRRRMAAGEDYRELVTPAVYHLLQATVN